MANQYRESTAEFSLNATSPFGLLSAPNHRQSSSFKGWFNPDEPAAGWTPHADRHPDTHARALPHKTLSAILQKRLKPHERGRDKGDVSSFEMARAWLDMKRVGECLGEQKAGAMWEKGRGGSRVEMVGGRPLIKRIILRCTLLQRSCPLGPDWLQCWNLCWLEKKERVEEEVKAQRRKGFQNDFGQGKCSRQRHVIRGHQAALDDRIFLKIQGHKEW